MQDRCFWLRCLFFPHGCSTIPASFVWEPTPFPLSAFSVFVSMVEPLINQWLCKMKAQRTDFHYYVVVLIPLDISESTRRGCLFLGLPMKALESIRPGSPDLPAFESRACAMHAYIIWNDLRFYLWDFLSNIPTDSVIKTWRNLPSNPFDLISVIIRMT